MTGRSEKRRMERKGKVRKGKERKKREERRVDLHFRREMGANYVHVSISRHRRNSQDFRDACHTTQHQPAPDHSMLSRTTLHYMIPFY